MKDLNQPEPAPLPVEGAAAWDLVIADMRERDRIGTANYGQRLTVGDGRNSLIDSYQEDLDSIVYKRKAIEEWGHALKLIEELEELVRHMCIHDGYPDNGYQQMTTGQKKLYCTVVGLRFTPLAPGAEGEVNEG